MSRGKEAFIPISEGGFRVSLNEKRHGAFQGQFKIRGMQKICEKCVYDCKVLNPSQKGGSSFECFKFLRRIG